MTRSPDPTPDSQEEPVPSAPGPSTPLTQSYTYHSPTPTANGPYILGVDEAGRGPVLGPLVYGIAYCPESYKEKLEGLGFADSKTLTAATRSTLLRTLCSDEENLGWSVRVICPQAISSGMLRRPPINLNRQSQEATVMLIQETLKKGIVLSEVYVDALGNTSTYEAYLSSQFPGIKFTVESKADFKFKIVGAASVAAKVTRDACLEEWTFEEPGYTPSEAEIGSGYPSGKSEIQRLSLWPSTSNPSRSQNTSLAQELPRTYLWLPQGGEIFLDNSQGIVRKGGPPGGMDGRGPSFVNQSIRKRAGILVIAS